MIPITPMLPSAATTDGTSTRIPATGERSTSDASSQMMPQMTTPLRSFSRPTRSLTALPIASTPPATSTFTSGGKWLSA